MVQVPTSYPKEPGVTRCGDSYLTSITVNGQIPGTDFTGGFSKVIHPVPMVAGSWAAPLFKSKKNFNDILDRDNGLRKRMADVEHALFIEDFRFTAKDRAAMKWLVDSLTNSMQRAELYANQIVKQTATGTFKDTGGYSKETQRHVTHALKTLRCLEYWTWRLIFYSQALEVYEPDPELTLSQGPPPKIFAAPLESTLPPQEPVPPSRTAAKKKDNTGLIVFGLGVLVAGAIFLPKLLRQSP
jgi:hypothetical protein